MNIVSHTTELLSVEALEELASLLATKDTDVAHASRRAIPCLLAGLAGLASREEGARRISKALADSAPLSGSAYRSALLTDASAVLKRGTVLLDSLFGGKPVFRLINAVGVPHGLSGGTTKDLLAYLLPLVMGGMAAVWKARDATPQALMTLLAEQKKNIVAALPQGFKLDDIPGFTPGETRPRARPHATAQKASRSTALWVVPLILVLIGGGGAWLLLRPQPESEQAAENTEDGAPVGQPAEQGSGETPSTSPDVATPDAAEQDAVMTRVTEMLDGFDATLAEITDAATAETALPQLNEMRRQLEGTVQTVASLPPSEQRPVTPILRERFEAMRVRFEEIRAKPELSEEVKSLIDEIDAKLNDI